MCVNEIDIISEEEKSQILVQFNNTRKEYPISESVHQLFEDQVSRVGEKISIFCREAFLSYTELNNRAEKLADRLREKGIVGDIPVGIIANHSLEMVIGIFGILKAGGGYLPIAPDYPQERIDYMLKDSAAGILVSGLNGECGVIELNHPRQSSPPLPHNYVMLSIPLVPPGFPGVS